jgi:peptidoglycan hydrolase-like protein with peptidoglycan-binding domain
MKNRFTIKMSDFLIAFITLFLGLAFVNAEGITVTAVPIQQFSNSSYVTYTNSNNTNQQVNQQQVVIINGIPFDKCCIIFNKILQNGTNGNQVIALQQLLNKTQGNNIPVTGNYGAATQNAVKQFQFKYGISPTGVVSHETMFALNRLNCGKVVNIVNNNYVAPTSLKVAKKIIYVAPKKQTNKISRTSVKKEIYSKAGTIVTDAIGAPRTINYGVKTNIKQDTKIGQIINIAEKELNKATTTVLATTTKTTVSPLTKLNNFFKNFWTNYEANFQK